MELVTNIDMIVAAHSATFSLPEVKRGVFAGAGALPRIVRTIGKQRAMEMALTGRTVSASEAMGWGLVNAVTDDAAIDAPVESRPVVRKALEYAAMITDNSPDSVIVSREGVKLGWEGLGAEEATRLVDETWGRRLREGQNIKEGGECSECPWCSDIANVEKFLPFRKRGSRSGFRANCEVCGKVSCAIGSFNEKSFACERKMVLHATRSVMHLGQMAVVLVVIPVIRSTLTPFK